MDVLHAVVGGWFAEPVPIAAAAAAVLVYESGARRLRAAPSPLAPSRSQKLLLIGGISVILVALLSPLDDWALRLQWVHMVQHLLLVLVAPPLIVLARPWDVGRAAFRGGISRLLALPQSMLAGRARRLWASVAAVVLFVGVLWLWHVPALYDLTLRDEAIHNLEHTAFLAAGLLFWTAALPRATPPALGLVARSAIVLAGMIGSWLLAIYIGYAPRVLYAYSGSGGVSATTDQQFAAGVMWVPGSVPFIVVLVVLVARWFEEDASAAAREAGLGHQAEA